MAFPIKNKCADMVADVLVDKIILWFGMPLVIHSDQGREFENGLMKLLCTLLGVCKDSNSTLSFGVRRDGGTFQLHLFDDAVDVCQRPAG